MTAFLSEDFLLNSETARRLYHDHAEKLPLVDYHTHLSAADIATDRRFGNLTEIWLEGDHYKWRAMRANGVVERFCSGDASPYDKFLEWAKTVPNTLRNPLFHWTHLELQRYFGIADWLNASAASRIWERANHILDEGLTVREILRKFRVKVVCTTDDPVDDLSAHDAIAASTSRTSDGGTAKSGPCVLPTFRPDRAMRIDDQAIFLPWLEQLRKASGIDVRNFATLLDALRHRHDFFGQHGCRASDHGLTTCYATPCTEENAAKIFAKVLDGRPVSQEEHDSYASFLMLFFGHLDAEKGWVKQLHLGARRNLSTLAMRNIGPDTGFDAIGDSPQGAALTTYLDLLQRENALPRMVLYNSNPADNYVFATIAASFHPSDGNSGALQYGPAWWFLDQKDGMVDQLNAVSNAGLLARFIGMTTDSRSFMSFPRHEYFRRILCELIGGEVEHGDLPNDELLLAGIIEDICYRNAEEYFGLGALQSDVSVHVPGDRTAGV